MKKVLALIAATVLSSCYCSPPLSRALLPSDGPTITEYFAGIRENVPLRGSGKVLFAFHGERQSGWFDLHCNHDRSFAATFYAPLGAVIASVTAHNDSGKIVIQGKESFLSPEQRLDSLSFPWGRELRFNDLTALLCGRIMPTLSFPQRPPDELRSGGIRTTAVWREKEFEISAIFSRSLRRLKRIVIKYHPNTGQAYSVTYDSFFDGKARYISFNVDDRNYFSIQYERLEKEPRGL
ncbi:MAG: hypothetical protein JW913_18800 [Chitinispirillaceae bacterium]|nr:hypothetical protein [Chitinispirillaceae bacterium]